VGRGGIGILELKTFNMVTINNGIVGTFVFRNEGDGCLNAKYMNEDERLPFTESCVLQQRNPNHQGYIGRYETAWFERNRIRQGGVLSIDQNTGNNAANAFTFFLEWRQQNNLIFQGIGMVSGELLVGAYWGIDHNGDHP